MDLNGKVAVVTGAGRGIGKSLAIALAKERCNVVLVSRTEEELKKTSSEINSLGSKSIYFNIDLSIKENIEMLINKTLDRFGTIDILINNAAVLYSSDFLDITEEEWDKTMNINLRSVFLLSQPILKIMEEKKSGYIINVSSTAALEVPPGIAAYGISKIAMNGLSQAMYEHGKSYNVKVSTIFPGMTDTKMLRELSPPVQKEKWMAPEDIAGCILFLLKQSDRTVVREIIPWAARHDKI